MTVKEWFKTLFRACTPPIVLTTYKKLGGNYKPILLEQADERWHLKQICIQKTGELELSDVLKIIKDGYPHPFYIRNNTSDIIVYKNVIEEREYNFITSYDPKVIIDAGANIGLSAIYFANKYPNAVIISIEPEKGNFFLLKENTKNYSNIIALNAALWHQCGEIELLDVGQDNWAFMTGDGTNYNKITAPKIQRKHIVKSVTIESLLSDFNLESVDVLKIDIEGAEKEVFEHHAVWVDKIQSIIVELHERMKEGCEKEFKNVSKKFDEIGQFKEDLYLSKNGYIKMGKHSLFN